MAFYRPQIAYVESWTYAAAIGSARLRTVSLPSISTTQATIFTAWTSAVASGNSAINGGNGSYYSSTGTALSPALGAGSAMSTGSGLGTYRYAACTLIGDAETIAVNTRLEPYLAAGIRYDFQLGAAASVGDPTLSIPINALLTIMVLDGTSSSVASTAQGRTGGTSNYAPAFGSNTYGVNLWLDAFYATQIHLASCFAAMGSADHVTNEGARWTSAAAASLPVSGSVPAIYHDVEVAANSPASSSTQNSFMWHVADPLSGAWSLMQYQSNTVPAEVMLAVPSQLVTILG